MEDELAVRVLMRSRQVPRMDTFFLAADVEDLADRGGRRHQRQEFADADRHRRRR